MDIIIREAELDDCEEIYKLNKEEMGYDYNIDKTQNRLKYILESENHKIYVAEVEKQVVGYIHGNDHELIYSDSLKNIMGIAVDKEFKRNGIGKMLIHAIESWALETGAIGVRLVSGSGRTGAHEFYVSCGYANKKDQKNFAKIFRTD